MKKRKLASVEPSNSLRISSDVGPATVEDSRSDASVLFETYRGFLQPCSPVAPDGAVRLPDGERFLGDLQAAELQGVSLEVVQDLHDHWRFEQIKDAPPEITASCNLVRHYIHDGALRRRHGHLPEAQYVQFVQMCVAAGVNVWQHGLETGVADDGTRRLTIRPSISLLRTIAASDPRYAGQVGPLFQRADGSWVDSWPGAEPPIAAKVGVLMKGSHDPLWAVASWRSCAEYVESDRGLVLSQHWGSHADVALAEYAEAQAIERAFGCPLCIGGNHAPR